MDKFCEEVEVKPVQPQFWLIFFCPLNVFFCCPLHYFFLVVDGGCLAIPTDSINPTPQWGGTGLD